jgi:hypothetical protein
MREKERNRETEKQRIRETEKERNRETEKQEENLERTFSPKKGKLNFFKGRENLFGFPKLNKIQVRKNARM